MTEPRPPLRRDGGFTLVEVLVTIVLIGVLGGIVAVGVGSLTTQGSTAACTASVDAARTAATGHLASTGSPPADLGQLVESGLLTLPADATLDATATVASNDDLTFVMRPGGTPSFSCDLADRTYVAAARSVPGASGYVRFGSPGTGDVVGGTTFVWPAGTSASDGVTTGDADGSAQFTSGVHLGGPYASTDVDAWDIGTGSLTIAFWYRDPSPAGGTVVRKSDGSNANGWIIDQSSTGALACRVDTNGGPAAWTPALGPAVEWRHAACVIDRDAAEIRLYIDGDERATADLASLAGRDLDAVASLYTNVYGMLSGRFDELGIWSRALRADEVSTIAAAR